MIPATNFKQFRSGNLIYNKRAEIIKWEGKYEADFKHPRMDHDYGYYFVELSEEWLKKFGFKSTGVKAVIDKDKSVECEWEKDMNLPNGLYISGNKENGYSFFSKDEWSNETHICKEFYFVHQLQNVVFSLTGEELTINT